ncbi:hypothetical protein [Rhodococcus sp. 06-1474-1B]|nr:hypothetical protein [Rhodococcus sp. 06-1474-1B]
MTIQRPSAVDDDATPACSADPSSWDLDASTKDRLKIAVRTCRFECPVYQACRDALAAGAVTPVSMVVAGIAYDYNGDVVDLDSPRARTGPRNERDTRWIDERGYSYNGHTGRWEPPVSATEQRRRRIA